MPEATADVIVPDKKPREKRQIFVFEIVDEHEFTVKHVCDSSKEARNWMKEKCNELCGKDRKFRIGNLSSEFSIELQSKPSVKFVS